MTNFVIHCRAIEYMSKRKYLLSHEEQFNMHDIPPDGVVIPTLPGYSVSSYVQLYNKIAN